MSSERGPKSTEVQPTSHHNGNLVGFYDPVTKILYHIPQCVPEQM